MPENREVLPRRSERAEQLALIDRVALAIHFVTYGREASEPLREKGGALDPKGMTYKQAVAAVHEMQKGSPDA